MVQDQPGSPPTASTGVVVKEGRKRRNRTIGDLVGRKQDAEELENAEDLKNVEVFVRAHTQSSPERHSATRNAI